MSASKTATSFPDVPYKRTWRERFTWVRVQTGEGHPYRFQGPLTLHKPTSLAHKMGDLTPHELIVGKHFGADKLSDSKKGPTAKVWIPHLDYMALEKVLGDPGASLIYSKDM